MASSTSTTTDSTTAPREDPLAGVDDAELERSEKINLRIQRKLLIVARIEAVPFDNETVQEICGALLEEAIRNRYQEGIARAKASIDRTIGDLGAPLADLPTFPMKDVKGISVYISPFALEIVSNLAIQKGVNLSVPKVCEPLLSQKLKEERQRAIETYTEVVRNLQDDP